MVAITNALYDQLAGDTGLTDLLATYSGAPAIFTVSPVPSDALLPYIITYGDLTVTRDDDTTTRGFEITRDIFIYAENTGSVASIETISETLANVLHKKSLNLTGYKTTRLNVSGPVEAPTDDTLYGRVVTINLSIYPTT